MDYASSSSSSLSGSDDFDSPYSNCMLSIKEEHSYPSGYSQRTQLGYALSPEMQNENNEFSKVDIRRLKNRESAARSRQKIKDKLESLEKRVSDLQEIKGTLMNKKFIIMNEIEIIENKLITISLEKLKNGNHGPIIQEAVSVV